MRRRGVLVAAVAAAGVLGLIGLGSFAAGDRFPHPTHDGLFSEGCPTCHAGIAGGDRAAFYSATADLCGGCHDGTSAPRVELTTPARRPTTLVFDHQSHVGERGIECLACHRDPGATGAMDVARARPEACLACHEAPAHLDEQARCATCHVPVEKAPSVTAERMRSFPKPPSHGTPDWSRRHGTPAASGATDCSFCHDSGFCSDCHNPGTTPGFHPRNYLLRHADEAWNRDTDCSGCHSTEVFCRSCHLGSGRAQRAADLNAYHDAEPLWVLNHGRAARQGLESCASCHQQTDCIACHSAKSGWGIKPHGSWKPEAEGGSEAMCRQCHVQVPGD